MKYHGDASRMCILTQHKDHEIPANLNKEIKTMVHPSLVILEKIKKKHPITVVASQVAVYA